MCGQGEIQALRIMLGCVGFVDVKGVPKRNRIQVDLIFNRGTSNNVMDIRISRGPGQSADSISIGQGEILHS